MSFIAGALAGVLSGWGVGGGTLLMIVMTSFLGVSQLEAQGINLLYFIPVSVTALISHIKNGYVEKRALLPAVLAGGAMAALGAIVAQALDMGLLRRIFGVFLIFTGAVELFSKPKNDSR